MNIMNNLIKIMFIHIELIHLYAQYKGTAPLLHWTCLSGPTHITLVIDHAVKHSYY